MGSFWVDAPPLLQVLPSRPLKRRRFSV
jgi:hypothetical protein